LGVGRVDVSGAVERIVIPLRTYLVATLLAASSVVAFAPRGDAASLPGQVVTVQAASSRSLVAVLRTWRLNGDGHYVRVSGPFVAFVGWHGVGRTREGAERTPSGVFTLTQAFGNEANNGTRLAYFRAGPDDWWDEDPDSAHYNRHVISRSSPGGNSENLFYSGPVYAHAVVINYNMNPVVKGAGSGFFLHVSDGLPTEGCVAIPADDLNVVMRWLDPAQHPVISIGVGSQALAVLGR
jgi:L,D-peptidoglycan transpeptidase YkuD (ErfK/YbiS/YcfS/YnhG family)